MMEIGEGNLFLYVFSGLKTNWISDVLDMRKEESGVMEEILKFLLCITG